MWPTENTLIFLLLGLVPLGIVLIQAARHNFMELLSLKFAGIFFLWIGYHFSPWYSYLSGKKWDYFLLVEKYIDQGLLFSSLCMFSYLFGFIIVSRKYSKNYFFIKDRPKLIFPKIKGKLVIILVILSFLMFLINVGGFAEMWRSTHFRGEGQFLERDFFARILQINAVLSTPMQTALACVAALYLLQSERSFFRRLMGWAGLLISSLSSMSSFSRGAGYSFLIFSFLSLRYKGRKALALATVSFAIAGYLASIGLNERGSYYPGLGNFLDAALTANVSGINSSKMSFPLTIQNPLDAMAPWSRKAEAADYEKSSVSIMGPRLLWNLNPLPSEVFPLAPLGRGLTEIMRTYGSSDITTPALAEVYYTFGILGFFVLIPLGAAYAWFENLTVRRPGAISSICLIICFVSFPIGLHSSLRAMTRPLVYAFVVTIIGMRLIRFNRRKRHRFYKTTHDIGGKNNCTQLNGVVALQRSEVNDQL
jgi:hypothetical protein